MAQKIVSVCDAHIDHEEHSGTPLPPISLDGVNFFGVDLCDVADKELIEPVRRLLGEYGRRLGDDELGTYRRAATKAAARKTPASNRRLTCPKCGQSMLRSTMRDHVETAHDTLLPIIEAELGHTLDGEPIVDYCRDCGGGFAHGAGRSAHQRSGKCRDWLQRLQQRQSQQLSTPALDLEPTPPPAKKTAAKKTAAAK